MLKKTLLSTRYLARIRSHQTSSNTWNPGQIVKQCEEQDLISYNQEIALSKEIVVILCEPKKEISR